MSSRIDRLLQTTLGQIFDFQPFFSNTCELHAGSRSYGDFRRVRYSHIVHFRFQKASAAGPVAQVQSEVIRPVCERGGRGRMKPQPDPSVQAARNGYAKQLENCDASRSKVCGRKKYSYAQY